MFLNEGLSLERLVLLPDEDPFDTLPRVEAESMLILFDPLCIEAPLSELKSLLCACFGSPSHFEFTFGTVGGSFCFCAVIIGVIVPPS